MSGFNEYPDKWCIIQIKPGKGIHPYYKVLASYYGGYGGSDSWRLNSGITKVVEKSHHYEFHGSSGSIYECGRKRYGMNIAANGIWNELQANALDEGYELQMMPEDTDWRELRFGVFPEE